jgi:hypothetical protein
MKGIKMVRNKEMILYMRDLTNEIKELIKGKETFDTPTQIKIAEWEGQAILFLESYDKKDSAVYETLKKVLADLPIPLSIIDAVTKFDGILKYIETEYKSTEIHERIIKGDN